MTDMNSTFRKKEGPTNVLSFPNEPDGVFDDDPNYLGDIAICADVVKQEARDQDKKLTDHYAHMTIHSILHLLGYDHIEKRDSEKMEALEIDLLSQLNISNPY